MSKKTHMEKRYRCKAAKKCKGSCFHKKEHSGRMMCFAPCGEWGVKGATCGPVK